MPTPTRRWLLPFSTTLSLALLACAQPQPEGGDGKGVAAVVSAAVPDTYPALGFDPRPDYIDDDTIILTFDDGPDWNNTARVLDVLAAKGVKASFFINTLNWSDVNVDEPMRALVRRMVDEGHELASHSVHHPHLPTLSMADIEAELSGVEATVNSVVGAGAPRLTLFRAPFGEPYQDGIGYDLVAPVIAQHAIHIGWNLDVYDYNCPMGDAACVLNNFKNGIKTPGQGSWGIVLLHSVQPQTADALAGMIDYAQANNFKFALIEDVVCSKFGKSSARVVDGTAGGCATGPVPMIDAGPGPNPTIDAGPGPQPGDPDAGEGPQPGDPDAGPGGGGGDDPVGGCGCRAGNGSEGNGSEGNGSGAGVLLLAPLAWLVLRPRRRR